MAYRRKYYKSLTSKGYSWTLEIYQDTEFAIAAVEIGPVLQSLRLIVQGDQADIDTPIVKTSLEMTFVDASDIDPSKKCGYWEEFYTSSATEYKVILYKNGTIEWQGYITPDSFSETLQYRGSVTIIARDNLGMLQDFEYDMVAGSADMVILRALLDRAMSVISFPMTYTIPTEGVRRIPYAGDEDALNILFNGEAFKDKTWLEVIESVLTSLGMVMRYVGRNKWIISTIADIPLFDYDYWMNVPTSEVKFVAYATRELSPAVKRIVEEVSFDIEENIAAVDMPEDCYSEVDTYPYYKYLYSGIGDSTIINVPVYLAQGSWFSPQLTNPLFFNPFAYALKEGHSSRKIGDLRATDVVYLAANVYEENNIRYAKWQKEIKPGRYKLSYTLDTPVGLYDNQTKVGFLDNVGLSGMIGRLSFESSDGSGKYYYDYYSNEWKSGVQVIEDSVLPAQHSKSFPCNIELPELEITKRGILNFAIHGVLLFFDYPDESEAEGAYIRLTNMSLVDLAMEETAIPEKMKVTTKYNEKNNILLQRKPEFGFNSGDVASPKIVRNGMYIMKDDWYESSDEWQFTPADTPNPYPVLVHQQMLAYYSKPNNVLTGELALTYPTWNRWYIWNGARHIMTSGALNILTGRMENVVLREFKQFGEVWGTTVDKDYIEMVSAGGTETISVSTNKDLQSKDIYNLPSWIIADISGYRFKTVRLTFARNGLLMARLAKIYIDNCPVFVKQLGA